jgi:hypothetical protein
MNVPAMTCWPKVLSKMEGMHSGSMERMHSGSAFCIRRDLKWCTHQCRYSGYANNGSMLHFHDYALLIRNLTLKRRASQSPMNQQDSEAFLSTCAGLTFPGALAVVFVVAILALP